MSKISNKQITQILSKNRVSKYLEHKNPSLTLIKYNNNIKLSEALLPSLHYFEVILRNNVDRAIKKIYGDRWLVNTPRQLQLSQKDIQKISTVTKSKTLRKGVKGNHNDILADMNLGFWCSFFHNKYDTILWHKKNILKSCFPNLTKAKRTRAALQDKIFKIKNLRNRIAHLEPIWHLPLLEYHQTIVDLINIMSSKAEFLLQPIDRFKEVYKSIDKKSI